MSSRAMKSRQGTKKTNTRAVILMVLAIILSVIIAGVIAVTTLVNSWLRDLPDYTNLDEFGYAMPTVVYASDGTTVLAEFLLEQREPVTLDQINDYVKKGTVATEDERFYEHDGVDIIGVGRALINNLSGGAIEGASTITQQFVRNTIMQSEMKDITFERKVREMYIAREVEKIYDKDEILLMYLNTINYGSGAYGIQAAAKRYFSKNAIDLTLNEAATLIGIPQSPTYNNPVDNPDQCLARRNVVLDRMVKNGVVTQEEADAAKAEPITLNETVPSTTGIISNPYFTSYVRNQLTDPDGRYAYSATEIFKGGLSVYTTIDLKLQADAEAAAANKEAEAGSGYEVSMVAIDPDNGYIKAMVGGKDYNATQVNMATGEGGTGRQAGSSFKTFTLVTAIEAGINPETMIDASTTVEYPGWTVSNINHANYGTRSIASAFAVSSNTAFARLCMSVGPENVAEMAHRLGIDSDLPQTGSVTLGTGSVTPLEMAEAYATIANGGTHYEPECITKIVDSKGNTIVDNSVPEGERVISTEVAAAALQVMKGVITGGTGTAAALWNGQEAAGKTGTSDDYMDSWFCGVTPQLSVAIWLGDRNDYSIARPVNGTTAASTFRDFMMRALEGQPIEYLPTANRPQYVSGFSDPENHIGGYYGSADENENASTNEGANTNGNIDGTLPDPSPNTNAGSDPSINDPTQPDPTLPDDPTPSDPTSPDVPPPAEPAV